MLLLSHNAERSPDHVGSPCINSPTCTPSQEQHQLLVIPDKGPHVSAKAMLIVDLYSSLHSWCHTDQRWTPQSSLSCILDSWNRGQNKMVIWSHYVAVGVLGSFLKGIRHLLQSAGSGFVNRLRSGNSMMGCNFPSWKAVIAFCSAALEFLNYSNQASP